MLKLFHKIEEERTFPNKATITVIPKSDKDVTIKIKKRETENYRQMLLMNIDAKIFKYSSKHNPTTH